jgi:hypothetical protein
MHATNSFFSLSAHASPSTPSLPALIPSLPNIRRAVYSTQVLANDILKLSIYFFTERYEWC